MRRKDFQLPGLTLRPIAQLTGLIGAAVAALSMLKS